MRRWMRSGRWSGNPATYPDWWPVAVEIRGERFEVGDPFTQVLAVPGRRLEYSRIIERREEFKELYMALPDDGRASSVGF